MYGTTIKNYNETKGTKLNKTKRDAVQTNKSGAQTTAKKSSKRVQDTKYMKINPQTNAPAYYDEAENNDRANESFSIKDLPIASVIITVILTMMMLVMTSGFGGL